MAGELLSADACRSQSQARGSAIGTPIPALCLPGVVDGIIPDRYTYKRLDVLKAAGKRLHGAMDVATLLAGKRLMFVGDALTDDFHNAFECALRREAIGETSQHMESWHAPRLQHACDRLGRAVARGLQRTDCSCSIEEDISWLRTNCQLLWRVPKFDTHGRPGTAEQLDSRPLSGNIGALGLTAQPFNFTVFGRFGDNWFGSRRRCQICEATGNRANPSGPCGESDWCAANPLPSQLELLLDTGAADFDVVVMNFGLQYVVADDFVNATIKALLELEEFGERTGKIAIFRESSAQHSPLQAHESARQRLTGQPSHEHKLSQCFPRGHGPEHPPGATPEMEGKGIKPPERALVELSGPRGRNQMLSKFHSLLGLRHVLIQPFEELTVERFDFHASPGKKVKQQQLPDCTHFCYSPTFWDLGFHSLYLTLVRAGVSWVRERHLAICTMHNASCAHEAPQSIVRAASDVHSAGIPTRGDEAVADGGKGSHRGGAGHRISTLKQNVGMPTQPRGRGAAIRDRQISDALTALFTEDRAAREAAVDGFVF